MPRGRDTSFEFMLGVIWWFFGLHWFFQLVISVAVYKAVQYALWILGTVSMAGKTVLITGGGSGIGRLLALEFARDDAKVVLWDLNEEGLAAVAAEVRALSFCCLCDLAHVRLTSTRVFARRFARLASRLSRPSAT